MVRSRSLVHIVITATVLSLILQIHANAPPTSMNLIAVGGSSGMGKAAALEAALQGAHKILLVSRNETKLQAARAEIQTRVPNAVIDICAMDCRDEASVQEFANKLDHEDCWDSLVVSSAGPAVHGPFATMPTSDARYMMESKFWTAYLCAKYIGPRLRKGGSIVLVAGILNRRPGLNCAPLAMANGALEALTRTLALEWGPRLRVNCLSPGFCDTERFDHMTVERKTQMLDHTATSLPLQRVGNSQDMGQAIYYLLTAPFVTGIVLDVDGGHLIRQYASPTNDPMRT